MDKALHHGIDVASVAEIGEASTCIVRLGVGQRPTSEIKRCLTGSSAVIAAAYGVSLRRHSV